MKKVLADFQRAYVVTLPANSQAAAAALLLDIQGDAGASRSALELEKLVGPNFLRLFEVLAEDGILTYLAVPTVDGEPVYVLRALPEVSLLAQPYFNETERLYIRRVGQKPLRTYAILPLGSWNIFTQTTRQGYGAHSADDFNNLWVPEITYSFQNAIATEVLQVTRRKLPGDLRNINLQFRPGGSQLYWAANWTETNTPNRTTNRQGSLASLGLLVKVGDYLFDKEMQHYPSQPGLNTNLVYLREMLLAEMRRMPIVNAATVGEVLANLLLPYPQTVQQLEEVLADAEPVSNDPTPADMDTLIEALPVAPKLHAIWTTTIRPDLSDEARIDTDDPMGGLGYERTSNPYSDNLPEDPTSVTETVIRHKTNQTQELYANIEEYVQKGLPVFLFISEEEITLTVSEDTATTISKQYAEMVGKPSAVLQVKSLSKVVRQVVSLFAR